MKQDVSFMESETVLKKYYASYLYNVRKLKKSSVAHYFDALNNISKRLKEKGLVKENIYEIGDLEQLERVRSILYQDPEFIEIDTRGRRMYSAGLNNYYRFACGTGLQKICENQISLDIPIHAQESIVIQQESWKRSGIIKTHVLELADYKCELDRRHESFIAEKTKKPYMEGHHAIPMKFQPNFKHSLDVYANIVCLCPICHRKIHHGLSNDKKLMLNQIYHERADRLANSGIQISKNEFLSLF